MAIASRVPGRSQSPAAGALEMAFPYAHNTRGNTATQNTPISNALCHGDERPPLPAICGRSWWLVFELLKGHLCLQDSAITWRLLAWHPIPVHVVPQRCFWGRSSDSSCSRHTVTIAGYRKSVVSVNRTAYHGYFDFLRLETGFEQLSGGFTVLEGGSPTKRNGLIFMRWTHIDLGAQNLNGIQRPKLFFQNSHK